MRPSSIDELPEELRAEIGRLRTQGATIDRIVEHLRTLHGSAPSRSAVGRHVKKMAAVGEKERKAAAARVEAIAKDAGITAATMDKIKAGIFGVRKAA